MVGNPADVSTSATTRAYHDTLQQVGWVQDTDAGASLLNAYKQPHWLSNRSCQVNLPRPADTMFAILNGKAAEATGGSDSVMSLPRDGVQPFPIATLHSPPSNSLEFLFGKVCTTAVNDRFYVYGQCHGQQAELHVYNVSGDKIGSVEFSSKTKGSETPAPATDDQNVEILSALFCPDYSQFLLVLDSRPAITMLKITESSIVTLVEIKLRGSTLPALKVGWCPTDRRYFYSFHRDYFCLWNTALVKRGSPGGVFLTVNSESEFGKFGQLVYFSTLRVEDYSRRPPAAPPRKASSSSGGPSTTKPVSALIEHLAEDLGSMGSDTSSVNNMLQSASEPDSASAPSVEGVHGMTDNATSSARESTVLSFCDFVVVAMGPHMSGRHRTVLDGNVSSRSSGATEELVVCLFDGGYLGVWNIYTGANGNNEFCLPTFLGSTRLSSLLDSPTSQDYFYSRMTTAHGSGMSLHLLGMSVLGKEDLLLNSEDPHTAASSVIILDVLNPNPVFRKSSEVTSIMSLSQLIRSMKTGSSSTPNGGSSSSSSSLSVISLGVATNFNTRISTFSICCLKKTAVPPQTPSNMPPSANLLLRSSVDSSSSPLNPCTLCVSPILQNINLVPVGGTVAPSGADEYRLFASLSSCINQCLLAVVTVRCKLTDTSKIPGSSSRRGSSSMDKQPAANNPTANGMHESVCMHLLLNVLNNGSQVPNPTPSGILAKYRTLIEQDGSGVYPETFDWTFGVVFDVSPARLLFQDTAAQPFLPLEAVRCFRLPPLCRSVCARVTSVDDCNVLQFSAFVQSFHWKSSAAATESADGHPTSQEMLFGVLQLPNVSSRDYHQHGLLFTVSPRIQVIDKFKLLQLINDQSSSSEAGGVGQTCETTFAAKYFQYPWVSLRQQSETTSGRLAGLIDQLPGTDTAWPNIKRPSSSTMFSVKSGHALSDNDVGTGIALDGGPSDVAPGLIAPPPGYGQVLYSVDANNMHLLEDSKVVPPTEAGNRFPANVPMAMPWAPNLSTSPALGYGESKDVRYLLNKLASVLFRELKMVEHRITKTLERERLSMIPEIQTLVGTMLQYQQQQFTMPNLMAMLDHVQKNHSPNSLGPEGGAALLAEIKRLRGSITDMQYQMTTARSAGQQATADASGAETASRLQQLFGSFESSIDKVLNEAIDAFSLSLNEILKEDVLGVIHNQATGYRETEEDNRTAAINAAVKSAMAEWIHTSRSETQEAVRTAVDHAIRMNLENSELRKYQEEMVNMNSTALSKLQDAISSMSTRDHHAQTKMHDSEGLLFTSFNKAVAESRDSIIQKCDSVGQMAAFLAEEIKQADRERRESHNRLSKDISALSQRFDELMVFLKYQPGAPSTRTTGYPPHANADMVEPTSSVGGPLPTAEYTGRRGHQAPSASSTGVILPPGDELSPAAHSRAAHAQLSAAYTDFPMTHPLFCAGYNPYRCAVPPPGLCPVHCAQAAGLKHHHHPAPANLFSSACMIPTAGGVFAPAAGTASTGVLTHGKTDHSTVFVPTSNRRPTTGDIAKQETTHTTTSRPSLSAAIPPVFETEEKGHRSRRAKAEHCRHMTADTPATQLDQADAASILRSTTLSAPTQQQQQYARKPQNEAQWGPYSHNQAMRPLSVSSESQSPEESADDDSSVIVTSNKPQLMGSDGLWFSTDNTNNNTHQSPRQMDMVESGHGGGKAARPSYSIPAREEALEMEQTNASSFRRKRREEEDSNNVSCPSYQRERVKSSRASNKIVSSSVVPESAPPPSSSTANHRYSSGTSYRDLPGNNAGWSTTTNMYSSGGSSSVRPPPAVELQPPQSGRHTSSSARKGSMGSSDMRNTTTGGANVVGLMASSVVVNASASGFERVDHDQNGMKVKELLLQLMSEMSWEEMFCRAMQEDRNASTGGYWVLSIVREFDPSEWLGTGGITVQFVNKLAKWTGQTNSTINNYNQNSRRQAADSRLLEQTSASNIPPLRSAILLGIAKVVTDSLLWLKGMCEFNPRLARVCSVGDPLRPNVPVSNAKLFSNSYAEVRLRLHWIRECLLLMDPSDPILLQAQLDEFFDEMAVVCFELVEALQEGRIANIPTIDDTSCTPDSQLSNLHDAIHTIQKSMLMLRKKASNFK